MSRKCLSEILSEPRTLAILTSKNKFKLSKNVLVLSFPSQNENRKFAVCTVLFVNDCYCLCILKYLDILFAVLNT